MNAAIHQLHPFVNFIYYLCVGILVMLFQHPFFLLSALMLLTAINLVHGNRRKIISSYPFFFLMGLTVIIFNPIFVRRGTNILFYFRHNPVTLEAVIYGLIMALLLISILILFLSFNHVIYGRKFMFLFRQLWPQLALLLMLTIRFVPLLLRRWREIYEVQRFRNYSMSTGSLRQRASSGMLYMQKLLTWSLEEALQSAESMKARGFGLAKRSAYQSFSMTARDWGMVIILLLLTTGGVVGARQEYGVLTIYPELGSFTLTYVDWLYYFLFILLVSFPLILEGRERIRWRLWS